MEWVSIDATHIRAHQSSAGAAGGDYQCIAKSVGGKVIPPLNKCSVK